MSAAEATAPTSRRSPGGIPTIAWLVLGGLLVHGLRVAWAWSDNPFARQPINDAEVYWDWAGRIARGELVGDEPFLSAPLYPYSLGLMRALGFCMLAVQAAQGVLHVATAALLARVGRRAFDARVGLAAGALYLLALDPSDSVHRLLAGGLQAFTVVLLLERWLVLREGPPTTPRAAALGLAFGLALLASPSLLIATPLLALDLLWRSRATDSSAKGSLAAGPVLAGLGCMLALVGLSTAHNVAASGEWIPISAQAGVTFAHGNQPGSSGVYTAAEGVSTSRIQQNRDAQGEAGAALGKEVGWKETSSYFFSKGLDTWRADPAFALELGLRKLGFFLFARDYGDIYQPGLERAAGHGPSSLLAPVRTAWIALPGLAAILFWLLRRQPLGLPAAVLAGVPLVVVCAFWYSPRYRLPAVPVLALGAGWCLVQAMAERRLLWASGFVVGLVSGPVLRATDYERTDDYRASFERLRGGVLAADGMLDEARVAYERARELGDPLAAVALADLVRRTGGAADALEALRAEARARPGDAYAWRSLATAAAEAAAQAAGSADAANAANTAPSAPSAAQLWQEARAAFEEAVGLDPNDWQARLGLGNVLLSTGDAAGARGQWRIAADLAPEEYEPWLGLARASAALGDGAGERQALEQLLELVPDASPYVRRLAELRAAAGEVASGLELLDAWLARRPQDTSLLLATSWLLATTPVESLRDGPRAEELAGRAQPRDPREEVERLDCLAAGQAAAGRHEEAARTAGTAVELLEQAGQAEWAAEVRARIERYRAGEAWVQQP